MASEWNLRCQFCDKNFRRRGNLLNHESTCNCKDNLDAHTQTESPGNAQGCKDVLGFHIPRQKRTVPAFPVLPEQHVKNPASDYAQGGINGATSEVKVDRDPEEETDVLEALLLLKEQPAYPGEDTFSDDEPGTGNLDDEPATNNPDQVLTTCSDKISSSMECYGGDERRVNARPIAGVEEDDLNRNVGCQGVTNCVDDSDLIQKQKRKPDLSVADLRDLVEMQQQNMKADINIHDQGHPSVMHMQNNRLGLDLLPHNNSSDHEVPTLSVSSMDDPNALVSTDTNSDKETETVNGGVDTNIPKHRYSSVTQMQNKKLGLDLLPRNDSSGHEVPTLSVSSADDLRSLVPTITNSDKDTNSSDTVLHNSSGVPVAVKKEVQTKCF